MTPTVSVIVPTIGAGAVRRLVESVAGQSEDCELIIADNGAQLSSSEVRAWGHEAEVLRFGENLGFGRAVNAAAEVAAGDILLITNDDCVLEPRYAERMRTSILAGGDIGMAAGILLMAGSPHLIDSAGIEFDRTLMAFDYLHGERVSTLTEASPAPVGPTGGAAGYLREAFTDAGGYDNRLFAYLEDVDLAMRLRMNGIECGLARGARSLHEHSATLGSGSRKKNYLMGFGRGHLLRKWGVLVPRRTPAVLGREALICAGQLLLDRNGAGLRGRWDGYRGARQEHLFPAALVADHAAAGSRFRTRLGRRLRKARSRAHPDA